MSFTNLPPIDRDNISSFPSYVTPDKVSGYGKIQGASRATQMLTSKLNRITKFLMDAFKAPFKLKMPKWQNNQRIIQQLQEFTTEIDRVFTNAMNKTPEATTREGTKMQLQTLAEYERKLTDIQSLIEKNTTKFSHEHQTTLSEISGCIKELQKKGQNEKEKLESHKSGFIKLKKSQNFKKTTVKTGFRGSFQKESDLKKKLTENLRKIQDKIDYLSRFDKQSVQTQSQYDTVTQEIKALRKQLESIDDSLTQFSEKYPNSKFSQKLSLQIQEQKLYLKFLNFEMKYKETELSIKKIKIENVIKLEGLNSLLQSDTLKQKNQDQEFEEFLNEIKQFEKNNKFFNIKKFENLKKHLNEQQESVKKKINDRIPFIKYEEAKRAFPQTLKNTNNLFKEINVAQHFITRSTKILEICANIEKMNKYLSDMENYAERLIDPNKHLSETIESFKNRLSDIKTKLNSAMEQNGKDFVEQFPNLQKKLGEYSDKFVNLVKDQRTSKINSSQADKLRTDIEGFKNIIDMFIKTTILYEDNKLLAENLESRIDTLLITVNNFIKHE